MSLRDLTTQLKAPTFSVTLPLANVKVQFRPWQVGDKKNILIALQDNDPVAVRDAVFKVLRQCIQNDDVNIDKLAATDLTYLLLHVRARSDNDIVGVHLRIPPTRCGKASSDADDEETRLCKAEGCVQKLKIDINTVEIRTPETYTEKVMITDSIGVKMKPPTLEHMQMYLAIQDQTESKGVVDEYFKIIASCIDMIFSGDEVYRSNEVPPEDLTGFVDSLSDPQFAKIQTWFESLPQLYSEQKWTCKRCNKRLEHTFKGVSDFFDLPSSMTH